MGFDRDGFYTTIAFKLLQPFAQNILHEFLWKTRRLFCFAIFTTISENIPHQGKIFFYYGYTMNQQNYESKVKVLNSYFRKLFFEYGVSVCLAAAREKLITSSTGPA